MVLKFLVDTIKGFTIWAPQNLDMKVKYPIRAVGELTSEPVLTGGISLVSLQLVIAYCPLIYGIFRDARFTMYKVQFVRLGGYATGLEQSLAPPTARAQSAERKPREVRVGHL